ncbi:glycine zipper 2TM domain-containing protein [Sphingomonas sp.]|uniref:glycine zipper 2TM domain-containing protein n=1 Tax=Sphingomonas sp. TaxID=28214 RepID=UPI0035BC3B33
MRKMMLALGCAAMAAPALLVPVAQADAQRYRDDRRSNSQYREWRDDRGRTRCRKPDGTTGLVVGGVAGALLGRTIDTRGDRTIGTLGGAAAGALAGRAIDRGSSNRRCR